MTKKIEGATYKLLEDTLCFPEGDLVVLVWDDNTDVPAFLAKDVHDTWKYPSECVGYEWFSSRIQEELDYADCWDYLMMEDVELLDEPKELIYEGTPKTLGGIYKSDGTRPWGSDLLGEDRVVLYYDDGSDSPLFVPYNWLRQNPSIKALIGTYEGKSLLIESYFEVYEYKELSRLVRVGSINSTEDIEVGDSIDKPVPSTIEPMVISESAITIKFPAGVETCRITQTLTGINITWEVD